MSEIRARTHRHVPKPRLADVLTEIEHSTAMRYATVAEHLLNDELEQKLDK